MPRAALLFAIFIVAAPAGAGLPWRRAHCDLRAFKSLPPLLLIGENHCSSGSRAVKVALMRYGAEGRLHAAFEVALRAPAYAPDPAYLFAIFGVRPRPESRVFGLESPLPHGLITTYVYAAGGATGGACGEDQKVEAMENFAALLPRNPWLGQAWRAVVKCQMLSPEVDGLRARLEAPGAAVFTDADHPAFVRLLRSVNAEYVALVNSGLMSEMGRSKPFTPYSDGSAEAVRDIGYVLDDLRDRDMGENLADVYCAAAAAGRPVAASVGAAHMSGMAADLGAWGAGRIPLKTARSDKRPRETAQAIEALASAGASPALGKSARGIESIISGEPLAAR